MKTLTLTVNNRPGYLRQLLDSLRRNNVDGYDLLYCAVEPGCPEVLDVCKAIDFIPTHVHLNAERLGVRENPYQALRAVFDMGSDFNVYLEDDLLVSPDALDLANWYLEQDERFAFKP